MAAVAMTMSPTDAVAKAKSETQQLRQACDEFIGMVMFGEMLKEARGSSLNSDLFSNSGTKLFQSQLDDVMLKDAAAGNGTQSMFGGLGDSLFDTLGGRRLIPRPTLDVQG